MLTLKRAFVYVTFACIAAAGFANPTLIVASCFYTLAVAFVAANMIASFASCDRRRTFHISVGIASAVYLWIAMEPGYDGNNHFLVTERLFYAMEGILPHHESGFPPPPPIGTPAQMPSESSFHTEHLLAVWHATWSIAIGEMAGLVTFHLTNRKSNVTI